MESCKMLFVLAFVMAITLAMNVAPSSGLGANLAKNISHDFILGSRVSGDRLVLQKTINKPSKTFQIVTHQETFNTTSTHYKITQVAAYDQKTNGNGAFVTLIKGGPGYQNVTLRFKSQRSHGINFIVRLYQR